MYTKRREILKPFNRKRTDVGIINAILKHERSHSKSQKSMERNLESLRLFYPSVYSTLICLIFFFKRRLLDCEYLSEFKYWNSLVNFKLFTPKKEISKHIFY